MRACYPASDALSGDVVSATQETIAQALGVRRTTATLIAQHLQLRGTISYSRGKIAIRDRAALQAAACDCYSLLVRRHWPSELLVADRSNKLRPVFPAAAFFAAGP
jgi:hypothetical protein